MLNQRLAMALFGVVLLPSCSNLPGPLQLMMQPVQQVRHSTNDRASGYYRLGRYHQERGDLDLALTGYTYAIARDPAAPEPRIAAAIIHARQGRLAQARAMLLAVCTEYPELVQPRNNLGYVYYLQGEYAAAAAAFRQALALEPANERARNNLALAEGASAQPVAALPPRPAPLAPPATGTVAGTTPAPASGPVAAPAPAPSEQATGMRLVRLAPNMYELRLRDRAPAPHVAGTPVPARAAAPIPVAAPRVKLAKQPVNAVKPAVAAALVKPAAPAAAARQARMAAANGAVRTATAPAAAKPAAPAAAAKPTAVVAATKPVVVASAKPVTVVAPAKPGAPAAAAKPAAFAAAKPAAAPPSAPAVVVQQSASRVEIANGNGVPGMARRYKEVLGKRGIAVSRLTNAKPFGRAGSSIEFVPGFERQARVLQAALGGKPSLQKAAPKAAADLRLVLGKDAVAWIERPTTTASPTAALLTSAGQMASINQ